MQGSYNTGSTIFNKSSVSQYFTRYSTSAVRSCNMHVRTGFTKNNFAIVNVIASSNPRYSNVFFNGRVSVSIHKQRQRNRCPHNELLLL